MIDRKKVITGLECCINDDRDCGWQHGDNPDCPYSEEKSSCVRQIMKEALFLLNVLNPETRVLTIEDIIDTRITPDILWMEVKDGEYTYIVPGVWQIDHYELTSGDILNDLGDEIAERPEAYGREWRVWWPERPTDELRKAVVWDD